MSNVGKKDRNRARMHDEVTQTLQTLGLLYETAFGIERWPQALDAITRLIGGNGALLFVNDVIGSGRIGTGRILTARRATCNSKRDFPRGMLPAP